METANVVEQKKGPKRLKRDGNGWYRVRKSYKMRKKWA